MVSWLRHHALNEGGVYSCADALGQAYTALGLPYLPASVLSLSSYPPACCHSAISPFPHFLFPISHFLIPGFITTHTDPLSLLGVGSGHETSNLCTRFISCRTICAAPVLHRIVRPLIVYAPSGVVLSPA